MTVTIRIANVGAILRIDAFSLVLHTSRPLWRATSKKLILRFRFVNRGRARCDTFRIAPHSWNFNGAKHTASFPRLYKLPIIDTGRIAGDATPRVKRSPEFGTVCEYVFCAAAGRLLLAQSGRDNRTVLCLLIAQNGHFFPRQKWQTLFDDLVGTAAQRQRHGDAERLGGLEIDVQFNFRCLLDR